MKRIILLGVLLVSLCMAVSSCKKDVYRSLDSTVWTTEFNESEGTGSDYFHESGQFQLEFQKATFSMSGKFDWTRAQYSRDPNHANGTVDISEHGVYVLDSPTVMLTFTDSGIIVYGRIVDKSVEDQYTHKTSVKQTIVFDRNPVRSSRYAPKEYYLRNY